MGVCKPDDCPDIESLEGDKGFDSLLRKLEVYFNGERVECRVVEREALPGYRGKGYAVVENVGDTVVCRLEHNGSVFSITYTDPASAGIEAWMIEEISREIVEKALSGKGRIHIRGINSFPRYLDFVYGKNSHSLSDEHSFGIIDGNGVVHIDIYRVLSDKPPRVDECVYVNREKTEAYSIHPEEDGYIAVRIRPDSRREDISDMISVAKLVHGMGGLERAAVYTEFMNGGNIVNAGNRSMELPPGDVVLFADIHYLGRADRRVRGKLERMMDKGYMLFQGSENGVVLYTTHTHDIYGIPQKFLVVSWVGRVSGGDIDKDALISAANETIRLANSEAHLAYHRATFACTATAVGVKN